MSQSANSVAKQKAPTSKSLRALPGTKQPKAKPKFSIKLDRNIDADLEIDPAIFVFLYGECLENITKEISGFGHISNGLIDWACISTVGTSGSVSTNVDDVTWATLQCIEACGESPNLQLHTHPDFDTYFSGVDTSDIAKFVDQIRDLSESGEMYFMVYNLGAMLVRKIEWTKDAAYYNDGKVTLNGYELRTTLKGQQTIATTQKGYYHYLDNDYEYFGSGPVTQPVNFTAKNNGILPQSQPLLIEEKGGTVRTVRAMRRSYRTLEGVIDDVVNKIKRNESIRGLLSPLMYYDLREMRSWMCNNGLDEAWGRVYSTMTEMCKDQDHSKEIEFLLDYSEVANDPAQDDGLRECVSVFNIANWFAAEAAIAQMMTIDHLRELGELLNAESGGVCFASVLTIMEDNCEIGDNEQEWMRANEAVTNSLPKNVIDIWNKWMEDIEKYDYRHTTTTTISA